MKIRLLLLLLCLMTRLSYSQVLKVYNGVGVSSNKNEMTLLSNKYYGYVGIVGIDYLKNKYYYLSSQLGYMSKGGKDRIYIVGENKSTYKDLKINWGYIHANTTFRLKTPSNSFYFYLGAGPKIEILTESIYIRSKEGYDIKLKPVLIGGIGEVGVVKRIKQVEFGFNTSYSFDFNDMGNTKNENLNKYSYAIKNHTVLITFFVGLDFLSLRHE